MGCSWGYAKLVLSSNNFISAPITFLYHLWGNRQLVVTWPQNWLYTFCRQSRCQRCQRCQLLLYFLLRWSLCVQRQGLDAVRLIMGAVGKTREEMSPSLPAWWVLSQVLSTHFLCYRLLFLSHSTSDLALKICRVCTIQEFQTKGCTCPIGFKGDGVKDCTGMLELLTLVCT